MPWLGPQVERAGGGADACSARPDLVPRPADANEGIGGVADRAEHQRFYGGFGDRARQLAYVLFQKATDKGWAEEAGAYNGLILAWPTLQSMGSSTDHDQQQKLL